MRNQISEIIAKILLTTCIGIFLGYTIFGTSGRVDEIKSRVPFNMEGRNWKILRYEGFEYGSWWNHGGKVWYHVSDADNPNIQYRVYVTLWDGELHYHYGGPEQLQRLEIDLK